MKKEVIILFLILIASVSSQELNDYSSLKIKTEISSNFHLDYQDGSQRINYVYANLTLFPENSEFQETSYKIITDPETQEDFSKNSIYMKWENPNQDLKFKVYSEELTKINFKKINKRINFPISENLDEFSDYLKETETVTSNDPKIIEKANELAQGEDDLFLLTYKIGKWTKTNINYSLETLTAEVSQTASWTLEKRFGVCDEITSLFVAMLRSLNVPARFVTGQAYTNVINGFGNHAWAEVYFPGYGWVAFDPTYGQFGYVDSTHIAMKKSLDVKDSDINYGWLSKNVDIKSNGIKINSSIIQKFDLNKEKISYEIELLKNEVGPSSYIPLKIIVKNENDYYIPVSIHISKAPVKVEDYTREILLMPKEKKEVFFIIKSPIGLEEGYKYKSDIGIRDNFNNEISTTLNFAKDYQRIEKEEAESLFSQLIKEEEKEYSEKIYLNCNLDKIYYYENESGKIDCEIKNNGEKYLSDLEVCYNKQCKEVQLNSLEKDILDFDFSPKDKTFIVIASNNEINKLAIIRPVIIKNPELKIELDYDKETDYFNEIMLKIKIKTNSEIRNLKIKLNNKDLHNLEKLSNERILGINLKGYSLREKNLIKIDYEDKNGTKYFSEEIFNLTIKKPVYVKYWWLIIGLILLIFSMTLRNKQHN